MKIMDEQHEGHLLPEGPAWLVTGTAQEGWAGLHGAHR